MTLKKCYNKIQTINVDHHINCVVININQTDHTLQLMHLYSEDLAPDKIHVIYDYRMTAHDRIYA